MRLPESYYKWTQFSVPEIATMLNRQYQDAWDQAIAWQIAFSTLDAHRRVLAKARAELADAWPTKYSSAAVEYMYLLEDLDQSLATTADAADANSRARSAVLDALENARLGIDLLQRNWQAQVTNIPDTTDPTNAKKSLNDAAHKLMDQTDEIIFESRLQLQKPQNYLPPNRTGQETATSVSTGSLSSEIPQGNTNQNDSMTTPVEDSVASQPSPRRSKTGPLTALPLPTLSHRMDVVSGLSVGILSVAGVAVKPSYPRQDRRATSEPGVASAQETGIHQVDAPTELSTRPGYGTPNQDNVAFPAAPVGALTRTSQRGARPRRRPIKSTPNALVTVPSLLVPRIDEPAVHDPGPGVIGIDR